MRTWRRARVGSGHAGEAVNVYAVGDRLVDAGTPQAKRRILEQLTGHDVRSHLVTHAHPGHFGSSHAVCEALGVPLWTGATDADNISRRRRSGRRRASASCS